ncbi:V-type proton ATPase subunit S1 [Metopolophium dirhodum]|uniref:V-type proton ATPase subunit S1 n=1 Tax=Metopolophium dirhodum TaxID=44670 RepID=UPI00298F6BC8|nr:V-type proton ATPase subunit S1 [Metopolophium dirhodum]
MSYYLILILGCLSALSLSTTNEVPTIAISCGNTKLETLSKYQQYMGTLEFKKLLLSLWDENTKVLMVLENELSLEDFTMKGTDGHSLFQLFENSEDRRFFPSVDQPEKALEMLSKNGFAVKVYNADTYKNSSEKIIALADLNENIHDSNDDSRQTTLLKHNNEVSKIFTALCTQYTNVVLVFSGKMNPWIEKSEASNAHHLVIRHLMAVDGKSEIFKIVDPKGKSLIYSVSYPTVSVNNGPDTPLEPSNTNTNVYLDDSRESLLKVGSTFLVNGTKVTLRFRFERITFSWELKSIEYERDNSIIQLTPKQQIGAQKGLSYFSAGPVIFSNDSIVLKFNDKFQVQPWLTSESPKFSDPQEQNSFFTPPILAGLFVTAIMLFIVTWGITMIMDIKTMDRFDDPKGKTITINVAE